MLKLGAGIVLMAALLALAGPALVPFDPAVQELPLRLAGPSAAHPLGLDELGRDILARLVAGARISLIVGVSVVSVSSIVGLIVGGIAGYAGGWADTLIGRVIDVLMAFPGILLAIALVAALGPSLRNVVIALATIGWVGYARVARGQVTMIENTVDTATGMVAVRASMPNEDELLWPGTLVTAQLTLRTDNAVTVPSSAVQVSQTGNFVFVVKGGVATVQPVNVARTQGQESVIESGLEGGETVVVDPILN